MAKKTRTTTKKAAKKTSSASSSKKKSAARFAKKKTIRKKPASKKSTKAPARKTAPKKKTAAAKKTTKKKTTKKPTSAKKTAKKPSSKSATTKKPGTKKAAPKKRPAAKKTTKAPASKQAASKKTQTKQAPATKDASGKPVRKGITIVSDRPRKKSAPKKIVARFPPTGDRLLGPGSPIRKPLIPSGPGRAAEVSRQRASAEPSDKKVKSPFNKRELDKFKAILLAKRAELFGDMSQMESGALRSNSGNLSHTPQHFAEQGSESYDQSLSLDLAAADRRLIIEIDDALQRIENKTFGICEITGKPIKKTRLDELPWARHSIDAARELERRSGFRA